MKCLKGIVPRIGIQPVIGGRRENARESFPLKKYKPVDQHIWNKNYEKYKAILL